MQFTVAVLPGDGVGPEVTAEAVKVIEKIGERFQHSFDIMTGRIGGNAIDEFGTPLPDETLEMCLGVDAIVFGAVGGPKWDNTNVGPRPEDGILAIRKCLGLFANLRPIKISPSLITASPVKENILEDVDMLIVRELTGGLYFSRPKKRWENSRGRRGVDTLLYTEEEIDRIVRVGFELARRRRNRLTSTDKANVLESSRLWREVATEVSQEYPDVELEHIYVDNLSMQLIRDPAHYDVIVAENTFGDIISDEAAVLSGSLGMLPSASLSAGMTSSPKPGNNTRLSPKKTRLGPALYEPIHGSAPDIAGQGIANPIGMILSVAMMLRHSLGLEKEATTIEQTVDNVLEEGYRTPDIFSEGKNEVNTSTMGSAIADKI